MASDLSKDIDIYDLLTHNADSISAWGEIVSEKGGRAADTDVGDITAAERAHCERHRRQEDEQEG